MKLQKSVCFAFAGFLSIISFAQAETSVCEGKENKLSNGELVTIQALSSQECQVSVKTKSVSGSLRGTVEQEKDEVHNCGQGNIIFKNSDPIAKAICEFYFEGKTNSNNSPVDCAKQTFKFYISGTYGQFTACTNSECSASRPKSFTCHH